MALDSDEARSFVARRCQCGYRHGQPQPCLNLGTSGLSLSTDAIIPHATTSYQNMKGPSTAPQELHCQERTVPKTILHCVSLAKRQFELLFLGAPKDDEPLSLVTARDWSECIAWARRLFDWCNEAWVDDVKRDFKASDSVWQGRALPDAVRFDDSDELVQQFVGAASLLKAAACGIQPLETSEQISTRFAAIARAAASHHLTPLSDDVHKSLSLITHFEKDDDTNFHVDFIAACANLKARMFHITPAICE
jgi:ubiquitin-activating enzyme E1